MVVEDGKSAILPTNAVKSRTKGFTKCTHATRLTVSIVIVLFNGKPHVGTYPKKEQTKSRERCLALMP